MSGPRSMRAGSQRPGKWKEERIANVKTELGGWLSYLPVGATPSGFESLAGEVLG